MSSDQTLGCIALLVALAPLVLLIVGIVQLQKVKAAVRNLVQRVGELESRGDRVSVAPPEPIAVSKAASPPPVPPPIPRAAPAAVTEIKQPPPSPLPARPPGAPPPPPSAPPPPPFVPPPPAKPFDWEAFFGVKLFAWIGGFVLFLGIVFLVKYSFDNNLITPAMRVAIGTVVCLALILTGWFTATRNYRVSGQSLCATGVLVLYGNIFAAHVFYRLIALGPAFGSMAVVTALGLSTPVDNSTGVRKPPSSPST